MNKDTTLALLRRLRASAIAPAVKRPPYFCPLWGLCCNFGMLCAHMEVRSTSFTGLFARYYDTWPHYSGEVDYPVPGGNETASEMYGITDDMYDQRTEYGRLRLELLDYIINIVENE